MQNHSTVQYTVHVLYILNLIQMPFSHLPFNLTRPTKPERDFNCTVLNCLFLSAGTEIRDGNNLIRVQKEDFNAYAALDMDSK